MGPGGVPKSRPCKFFTSNGSPYQGGCNRDANACHFIHPKDREWDIYWRDHRPRSRSGSRERGRRRTQRFSPPPPRRSGYRDRRNSNTSSIEEGQPFVSTSKRPPIDPSAWGLKSPQDEETKPDVRALERERLSGQRAPTPPELLRAREKARREAEDPVPLPAPGLTPINTQMASMSMSMAVAGQTPTTPVAPPPWTPSVAPLATPTWPPPTTPLMPLDSPSVQPPPPLPDAPDFELDPADAAAKELWERRITQLANIVEAAQEEHVLSKNIKDLQSFANATHFPEELRSQYQTKLSEVVARQAAQKAQCDGLIQELIRSDNAWPMSQVQMERDAKLQEKYDEMVQYVNELKGIAGEMGKALKELGIEKPPPPPVPPVVSQEEQDAMDVDEKPPGNRGLSEKEYETILDKLADLETSIASVENAQVQNERETREEWLDLIELRLKDLKASLAKEDSSEAEDEDENAMQEDAPETLGQLRQRVTEIAKQTTTTNADLAEVSSILEGFHSETTDLSSQLSDALQDYHNAQQKQNQLQERLEQCMAKQEQDSRELLALQASLNAHLSRPPSPPASPPMPSKDILLRILHEPLTSALRTAVKPMVQEVRNDVYDKLSSQSGEIYGAVWEKVHKTLAVLDLVQAKLGQQAGAVQQSVQQPKSS